jgi:ligand-binding SRPBCC domain-containing protein
MRILSERVYIQAPAGAVWAVLADFGGVADWAPYMKKSHLIGDIKRGVGTRRGMRHAWGFRFEEAVTEWTEGSGFCFDVFQAPFPMKDVRETWVTASDNGLSTVRTRVSYDMRLGLIGRLLDWLLVRFIVTREMRAGLRGLKQYLEDGEGKAIALQFAD